METEREAEVSCPQLGRSWQYSLTITHWHTSCRHRRSLTQLVIAGWLSWRITTSIFGTTLERRMGMRMVSLDSLVRWMRWRLSIQSWRKLEEWPWWCLFVLKLDHPADIPVPPRKYCLTISQSWSHSRSSPAFSKVEGSLWPRVGEEDLWSWTVNTSGPLPSAGRPRIHERMGHLGAERVEELSRQRFYWQYMNKDI